MLNTSLAYPSRFKVSDLRKKAKRSWATKFLMELMELLSLILNYNKRDIRVSPSSSLYIIERREKKLNTGIVQA